MNPIFHDLFIFEMANNHQGQVEHGLKIIQAMGVIQRRYGIRDAVKFQYRDLDTFIHPDFKDRKDVKHIPRFLDTRLSDADFRKLVEEVRRQEMCVIVTPFDEASVAKCIEHGVDIIKIASCSADDWPLIEAIADTRKPVIASTGGVSIYDIDNLASYFNHRKTEYALLHCVGLYPTKNENVHMGFLTRLAYRYPGVPVGYSGHEAPDNLDVVSAAVSRGATILERHVGLATERIKLNAYSMDPEQTERWVAAALRARTINGNSTSKHTTQDEVDSLLSLKRGVFAKRPISKGQAITREDVFFAMPCASGQTTSGDFGRLRTVYHATRDYVVNDAILERAEIDRALEIRRIIHDAKGMLSEAHIVLADDDQIDLSHHLGIDKFRHTGAIIVNVVNRTYCKKYILVLPGQRHPNHRHIQKEETFQLIWGDLEVKMNGTSMQLQRGQKVLVERGAWHSFSSASGAIFEEVSTTHVVGDSYYEDENISKLDVVQRKTVLTGW
jgi:sialic acid synthase SpsE/mannose-6-phosphate isomerase-like protein (cupin superfamily)